MKNQIDRLGLNSRNKAMVWYRWGSAVLTIFFTALLFYGCGTSKAVKQARQTALEAYEIQKPVQVRTSNEDKRPKWTKQTVFEDDSGMLYFSGGFLNGADYPVTVRCANAEALKVAVQSISQFIRSEFTQFVKGSNLPANPIDRYVEDGIATFTGSLHMQGVRQKEIYYEEVFSPSVMTPAYNVWVQLEISKSDYLFAKSEVLRHLRERFSKEGHREAKERAEKLLEKLKEEASRYGA